MPSFQVWVQDSPRKRHDAGFSVNRALEEDARQTAAFILDVDPSQIHLETTRTS